MGLENTYEQKSGWISISKPLARVLKQKELRNA